MKRPLLDSKPWTDAISPFRSARATSPHSTTRLPGAKATVSSAVVAASAPAIAAASAQAAAAASAQAALVASAPAAGTVPSTSVLSASIAAASAPAAAVPSTAVPSTALAAVSAPAAALLSRAIPSGASAQAAVTVAAAATARRRVVVPCASSPLPFEGSAGRDDVTSSLVTVAGVGADLRLVSIGPRGTRPLCIARVSTTIASGHS